MKNNKTVSEIKEEMLAFKDLFGGQFLDFIEIINANILDELEMIVERYEIHLESACNDAQHSLNRFKR